MICVLLINNRGSLYSYIRITKYRKKEIIQNLIQQEIEKDLKQKNENILYLRSAKG